MVAVDDPGIWLISRVRWRCVRYQGPAWTWLPTRTVSRGERMSHRAPHRAVPLCGDCRHLFLAWRMPGHRLWVAPSHQHRESPVAALAEARQSDRRVKGGILTAALRQCHKVSFPGLMPMTRSSWRQAVDNAALLRLRISTAVPRPLACASRPWEIGWWLPRMNQEGLARAGHRAGVVGRSASGAASVKINPLDVCMPGFSSGAVGAVLRLRG
jgi:hypothetical protein